MVVDADGDGRVDGELGDVALDALVVGPRRGLLGQAADALLHHARELPALGDVLGQPAHPLRVGAEDRDGAHVVQEVLGGHRLGAHARLAESDVLGRVVVELVRDHRHRHALLHPVGGVGVGGVGRRRDDVVVGDDLEQVRRVTAARALHVVHVDGAAVDGRHGVFAEPELVDRVGVQVHGEIVAVGGDEAWSMTAGAAPKSSWILTAMPPAATDSSTASGLEAPRPNSA